MSEHEADELSREFLLYLRSFFHLWLSGRANPHAITNDRPVFISWDKIMGYWRVKKRYEDLIAEEYLFSKNAKQLLCERLEQDGLVNQHENGFDYINPQNGDYRVWLNRYFQSIAVKRQTLPSYEPDGLTAALASFMLYALAKGTIRPKSGKHEITVEEVAVLAKDAFNFTDTKDDIENGKSESYLFWNCDPPGFGITPFYAPYGAKELFNRDFNEFRRLGFGNDFIILAGPHMVESTWGKSYVYIWPE